MYTDGSKSDQSISTSASVITEDHEDGFYFSLPKECSIFTAETVVISTA